MSGYLRQRRLDPALGRWCQIDPKAEATMPLTPYGSMNNNPISNIDPNGDIAFLAAVGISAAIGGIAGGIQDGWNGAWKGALIGGATSAATFGIGSAFGATSGFANELGRAGAHGLVNGLSSELSGGSFGSGFLSGAVSSGFGSAFDGAKGLDAYIGGGFTGGIASLVGGGNFLTGFGQGLVVTAMNHQAHNDCPDCPLKTTGPEVLVTAKRPKYLNSMAAVANGIGTASTLYGDYYYSGGKYRGASGNYYSVRSQGWNQYTGTKAHMNSVLHKANLARGLNYGSGALGAASNFYNYGTGNINELQLGIEMGSTAISTFGTPMVSVPWTIGYEVLGRNGITRIPWYQNRFKPWVRRKLGIKD